MAKLYLIPTPLGSEAPLSRALPAENREIIETLDCFVVENTRTARRFLSRLPIGRPIDGLHFAELNEHTPEAEIPSLLAPALEGRNIGLLSEAGLPCVADPGARLVEAAHAAGVEVVPLVGPSSLLLALMASGANGQSFAFRGYLPVKDPARRQAIVQAERRAQGGESQLFIEAPYRNGQLLQSFLSVCAPATRLTVAVDLLEPSQQIITRTVAAWKKEREALDLHKRPAIFILF